MFVDDYHHYLMQCIGFYITVLRVIVLVGVPDVSGMIIRNHAI